MRLAINKEESGQWLGDQHWEPSVWAAQVPLLSHLVHHSYMVWSWLHKLWGLLLTSASPCGLLMWGDVAGDCKEKTRRLRCYLHVDATRWEYPQAREMMTVRNCGENLELPSVLVPVRGTDYTSEKNVRKRLRVREHRAWRVSVWGEPPGSSGHHLYLLSQSEWFPYGSFVSTEVHFDWMLLLIWIYLIYFINSYQQIRKPWWCACMCQAPVPGTWPGTLVPAGAMAGSVSFSCDSAGMSLQEAALRDLIWKLGSSSR